MIVKNIAYLCERNNISLRKLAEELKFSASGVSRWDDSSPSADKVLKIARRFNTTVEALLLEDLSHQALPDLLLLNLTTRTEDSELVWRAVDKEEHAWKYIAKDDAVLGHSDYFFPSDVEYNERMPELLNVFEYKAEEGAVYVAYHYESVDGEPGSQCKEWLYFAIDNGDGFPQIINCDNKKLERLYRAINDKLYTEPRMAKNEAFMKKILGID